MSRHCWVKPEGTIPSSHNWFVLVKENEDILELARMLAESVLLAKKEGKFLKVSVQKLEPEDSF